MELEQVTIVFRLPGGILSPNNPPGSIGSRFAKAAAAKKYRQLVKETVEAECIETGPWQKVEVDVVFFFAVKRRRDEDNAMGSLKAAYDGIVDAGLVVDDDYEHMRRNIPEFLIDREHPRVMLTIKRLQC